MRRREFTTLLAGAAAASVWPRAARAQQGERTRRIGVLMTFAEADPEGQSRLAAFLTALRQFGWIDGRNARIAIRWSPGALARTQQDARELIALQPDVMLVMSTPVLTAVQRETNTIPIVFVQVSDPVRAGFVSSMQRPGGNMTGFANFEAPMGGKWLELLKEVAPNVKRVAILMRAGIALHLAYWRVAQDAAASFGVKVTAMEIHDPGEVERALAIFTAQGNGGLIVTPDPIFNTIRDEIVEWTARYRLPAIYPFRFYAQKGGLLSYGLDQLDQWRAAAGYIDRILRGEKPAELPVQGPTKFELTINLKTAKALGLAIPPSILLRADRVIE